MRIIYSALLLTSASIFAAPVLAGDVPCPPSFGSETVDGDIVIAARCTLDGTTVKGNVRLYTGGSLVAKGIRIIGNIQAENADFIDVDDSHVNGSIQLDNLVGSESVVRNSTIGGSIQLKSNRSRLEVLDNIVTADVQAFSNRGGVVIADSIIDGNLQCKENDPAPTGGNNRVQGNKEDQCESLLPEPTADGAPPQQRNTAAEAATSQSSGGGALDPAALLLLAGALLMLQGRLLRSR